MNFQELNEYLGRSLALARTKRKITQAQLADRIGKTQQSVAKWECGRSLPSRNTMVALTNELGVFWRSDIELPRAADLRLAPRAAALVSYMRALTAGTPQELTVQPVGEPQSDGGRPHADRSLQLQQALLNVRYIEGALRLQMAGRSGPAHVTAFDSRALLQMAGDAAQAIESAIHEGDSSAPQDNAMRRIRPAG